MAQAGKGKLNYRCPSCFMRDIDIDLFYDEEKKEYYCLRCCFHASEAEVLERNQTARFRYKSMLKRFDLEQGGDTAPLTEMTEEKAARGEADV